MQLRSICCLSLLQVTLTCVIAGEPAPLRDGSHDSISLSVTGRLTYAAYLIAVLVPTTGSSITASRIIRSFSIAMLILRSLTSTIQRSICTSRRRPSGYIIRLASMEYLFARPQQRHSELTLFVSLMGIAANFTTRNCTKAAPFRCATFG